MVKNTIKVYARLKPELNANKKMHYELKQQTEYEELFLEQQTFRDRINSRPQSNKFRYYKVLEPAVLQETVFEMVAKPIVNSILNGYNGTIIAYGQTGSGKTYTITGAPDKYSERGIIPRCIQHIFNTIEDIPNVIYTIYISYMEIYNEIGYDLLDPNHQASKLEDLQRVSILEDSHGRIHLRNLSVQTVSGEAEALRLLFLGDTNRTIAETPMNPYSSRSHCIFTVHISLRNAQCRRVRRSKLHIVDLAGSERIFKTCLNGQTLTEAKHINLSLHFLEQVIIALGETGRTHVPYRNSMMTSVLRDSLGGNCLTAMIATMSLHQTNIEETLSTCRFAQRVAMVSNEAKLNEDLDPQQEVVYLREEVARLRAQLKVLTGGNELTEQLSAEQIDKCKELVANYVKSSNEELTVEPDMRQIQVCFKLLRQALIDKGRISSSVRNSGDSKDAESYMELLKQRDDEISILINELKKEKNKSAHQVTKQSSKTSLTSNKPVRKNEEIVTAKEQVNDNAEQEAFCAFMANENNSRDFRIQENNLKEIYGKAKVMSDKLEVCRENIIFLRKEIDKNQTRNPEALPKLYSQLEIQQQFYKSNLTELQKLKTECEHIKHGLENSKIRLLRRFQDGWRNKKGDQSVSRSPSSHFIDPVIEMNSGDKQSLFPLSDQHVDLNTLAMQQSAFGLSTNLINSDLRRSDNVGFVDSPKQNMPYQMNTPCNLPANFYAANQQHSEFQNRISNSEMNVVVGTSQSVADNTQNNVKTESCCHGSSTNLDMNNIKQALKEILLSPEFQGCQMNFGSRQNTLQETSACCNKPSPSRQNNETYQDVSSRPSSHNQIEEPQVQSSDEMDDEFLKTIPLTGDKEVDEEIIAFYKARHKALRFE